MADTSIEWTDKTWNPTKGCFKVSGGCKNCYAIRMAARLQSMQTPHYENLVNYENNKQNWSGVVSLDYAALTAPLSWKKPRRIFVNSMSDLFYEEIPKNFIKKVWQVMGEASQHQFQVLTKRPKRMLELLQNTEEFPVLENVWLGVSVEDGNHVDRIDVLRSIPAKIKFISFEPLIGSVKGVNLRNIDWAIVGGESGPRARLLDSDWIGEIKNACDLSGTAFFFKQWGGVNKKKAGRVWNNKVWDAYPDDIINFPLNA